MPSFVAGCEAKARCELYSLRKNKYRHTHEPECFSFLWKCSKCEGTKQYYLNCPCPRDRTYPKPWWLDSNLCTACFLSDISKRPR